MNGPFPQPDPFGQKPIFENPPPLERDPTEVRSHLGHVSENWVKGKFDIPLTQKFDFGDAKFRVDTHVDDHGNVSPGGFGG